VKYQAMHQNKDVVDKKHDDEGQKNIPKIKR